jgi:hypothetical protein
MSKKITTQILLDRVKKANPHMFDNCDYTNTVYSNRRTKITVICKLHGQFNVWPGDHMRGFSGCKNCIDEKRKSTMIERYGVDNFFKRNDLIQISMMNKHKVSNPGLMMDHLEKVKKTNISRYGTEWAKTKEIEQKCKETNLLKYGCEYPMQNSIIIQKMMNTKIKNGSFTKSNSSKAASNWILDYVNRKEYSIEQCAFAYEPLNLFEWGMFFEKSWILFDLVVFEKNHRGDKSKIIEILEYHGPFHYTLEDCISRGNERAYPWKDKITTINESYKRDKQKERLGKMLTKNYNVFWERSNSFDPYYSENRQAGDL